MLLCQVAIIMLNVKSLSVSKLSSESGTGVEVFHSADDFAVLGSTIMTSSSAIAEGPRDALSQLRRTDRQTERNRPTTSNIAADRHKLLTVGGNVDHIHRRDLYSARRPSRRNGFYRATQLC